MTNHESSRLDLAAEKHSIGQSLVLHLLPGMIMGGVYFALRPLLEAYGYPSLMALALTAILILIPFELGYLFYEGKKRNGAFSLKGIVLYRQPIPVWQYFVLVPLLFVITGAIFTVMRPVDNWLYTTFFDWMPQVDMGLTGEYSRSALIVTYVVAFLSVAVVGPVVEELYFRGYLLPRLDLGKWSLFVHSLLFALYHTFTPWLFVTRTLGMIPLAYTAQRRNVYVAAIVHVLANTLDIITGIIFISSIP